MKRDIRGWRALVADVDAVEAQIRTLVAGSAGEVLTTLPGVKEIRAASFAVQALPIERFPTAEHLYSFTGLGAGPL